MPSSAALAAHPATDNNHSAQIVASRSPQLFKRPQTRFKKRKRMAPRVDQFVASDFECDAPLIGSGWRTQHRGPVQSVLLPQKHAKAPHSNVSFKFEKLFADPKPGAAQLLRIIRHIPLHRNAIGDPGVALDYGGRACEFHRHGLRRSLQRLPSRQVGIESADQRAGRHRVR